MVDKAQNEISNRSSRILLVDDEAIVRKVIRTVLEQPGLYMVEAEDGEKAIELLLAEPFDLIIADKNLPGITGLDVIRRAKAVDPRMGALLITAYASRESADEAMAMGVDDYLVKPFEMNDLLEKVDEALEFRQQRGKAEASASLDPVSSEPVSSDLASLDRSIHLNVVVCDGFSEDRRLLMDALRLLGHQAEEVGNLREVLVALREGRAEAALCDLDLFSQDNATACFLRSRLLLSNQLRMVVVATERGLQDAVEAIHRGAGLVIYRPLADARQVADSLRDYLLGDPSVKPAGSTG